LPKHTSSEEFLKGYNAIWKNGPAVKYTNPDSWRHGQKEY
jgi:hypothetical protein